MSKALIVDDDKDVLKDNQEYFERLGYETVCADTAAAAENIINSAALDCVILDIDLTDRNGFELFARVREKTGLPIVFLSGYTEEQNRIKGLSIGGDAPAAYKSWSFGRGLKPSRTPCRRDLSLLLLPKQVIKRYEYDFIRTSAAHKKAPPWSIPCTLPSLQK